MLIYEPITMLKPTSSMVGKRCISKAGKHDLGVITLAHYDNSVQSSKMTGIGLTGRAYYNWLAIFGYPADYSIQALLNVVANMDTIKCLMADYGPGNNRVVEIL
jgi:hypothetical protein